MPFLFFEVSAIDASDSCVERMVGVYLQFNKLIAGDGTDVISSDYIDATKLRHFVFLLYQKSNLFI